LRFAPSMSLASQLSEKSKRLPPSSTTTLSTLRMLRPLADVGESVAPPTSCHLGALVRVRVRLTLRRRLRPGLGLSRLRMLSPLHDIVEAAEALSAEGDLLDALAAQDRVWRGEWIDVRRL